MDEDAQLESTCLAASDDNYIQEEEEALSLHDFPITSTPPDYDSQATSDLFAFCNSNFNTSNNNMSHADEIFSCGKIIPCKPALDQSSIIHYDPPINKNKGSIRLHEFARKPSESMKNNTSTIVTDPKVLRISRSLDDQKLYRRSSKRSMDFPKHATTISQWNSSPLINNCYSERKIADVSKPKWSHWMMFGPVKLRPEMELRDMKSRQGRRTPQLVIVEDKKVIGSSWRIILDALSCKTHASLPVTTSS